MFDGRIFWPCFHLARHMVFLAKGVELLLVELSQQIFSSKRILPTIESVYAAGPSFAGSKFLKFTTQIHKPMPDADRFISQLSRVLKEKAVSPVLGVSRPGRVNSEG